MKVLLILVAALGLAAQQPTVRCIDGKGCESDGKPVVPVIDPTAAAAFWKAQAELLQAKIALMEKDAAAQAALAKVSCGDGYEVAGSKSPLGLECKKK